MLTQLPELGFEEMAPNQLGPSQLAGLPLTCLSPLLCGGAAALVASAAALAAAALAARVMLPRLSEVASPPPNGGVVFLNEVMRVISFLSVISGISPSLSFCINSHLHRYLIEDFEAQLCKHQFLFLSAATSAVFKLMGSFRCNKT